MNKQSNHHDPAQNTQYAAFVWLVVASVIGVVLYTTYYFSEKIRKKEKNSRAADVQTAEPNRPVAGGRRPRRMRVREEDDFDRFDDSDDEKSENWGNDKAEGKIGAKKQKKLELKAEKRAERQAELEERDERKKREAAVALERKKEDERKEKEDSEKAELERQKKEEQERKEHEEYLRLKEAFTIEEEGEIGILTEEESQSLLQEFLDYIQKKKIVLLEELALQFNLKTHEAIERLENLQELGRLTGVMDDRGKFIYISEDELKNVAKFIKQRGRISIADLAESSNTLITLKEENTDYAPKIVNVTT